MHAKVRVRVELSNMVVFKFLSAKLTCLNTIQNLLAKKILLKFTTESCEHVPISVE